MNNIYIENNDTDNLDYFSLLKLGFYNILSQKKKNDENKKIIIAHSDNCNGYCEYDEWIEKNLTSNGHLFKILLNQLYILRSETMERSIYMD